jgi:hypothetical protein
MTVFADAGNVSVQIAAIASRADVSLLTNRLQVNRLTQAMPEVKN